MKYQLENIPVWRAFEAQADCALCFLECEVEPQYVRFFLGNSVMVPEMRVEVNRTGFCSRHLDLLLANGENKLGLSLMLETHLEALIGRVDSALGESSRPAKRLSWFANRSKSAPNGADKTATDASATDVSATDTSAARASATLAELGSRCLLCERLERTIANFTYTIVVLYDRQDDFRSALRESNGFCLRHLPRITAMASRELRRELRESWWADLRSVEAKLVARVRADLSAFAEKFDYRNREEMSPEARASLPRAVNFLGGRTVSPT